VVVLLGDLNLFMGDLLARWLILGGAWLWALLFGQLLWRRQAIGASGFGLAALAVLVNLLAAGGIGIPSVALALWTLIALGLNLREDRPCSRLRTVVDRAPAFGLAVVWAALTGLFFGSVVMTFWRSERAIAAAEDALSPRKRDFRRAELAYTRAIELDHYSARPWLGMAMLEYEAWKESGGLPENKKWRAIPISLLKAASPPRNPNAWSLHRDRAVITRDLLTQIGGRLPPDELIRFRANIVEAARKATLLYPTNASLHALLAEASAEMGDMGPAVREAEEALRLDRLMPHVEKKLPEAARKRLENQLPVWRTAAEGMKRSSG
jgi:hypothetical protein